ncbi:hypothetical protein [Aeromonas veronii]|uniref:hypothetical protein n=1 Tax=Aeromonas veronii TaxID=654 RepID=UPI001882654D|nr:hypothetical protein [Aeromonas veronii]MBE8733912.1 hypothetical protein [Aeromonas veronii]MBE8738303.1 hypothetical protein [Aeromonas veronii]MBE8741898.1 hypothetical protein [Aeromonas veronii]MBE8763248.1 hypothetical protein [Aeromonas veronii]MBE8837860.1 hypothetical protein [Aeromonas veronii]
MRIYGKNEAGEAVYIADCPLPKAAYAELDSGHSFHLELLPVVPLGNCSAKQPSSVMSERILLEPYRLYRNKILVEMGAIIADPLHLRMLADNIQELAAVRLEAQAVVDSWAVEPQER